jgi:hypothetical protein
MEENLDINQAVFPMVTEGDRALWSDGKYYIYTNGIWVEEVN